MSNKWYIFKMRSGEIEATKHFSDYDNYSHRINESIDEFSLVEAQGYEDAKNQGKILFGGI